VCEVELDANVFGVWVPDMILCESHWSVVVAEYACGARWQEMDALKKLSQKDGFMGGVVQSHVFCIAGGIGDSGLFV